MPRRNNEQHTAMNDMLSNIALGFIMLFIIALIMMNPIAKQGDIPSRNEVMIIMEWADDSRDDVDLWVQFNDAAPVGFTNRHEDHITLERDDVGVGGDSVVIDGVTQYIRINREVVNIRAIVPGNYYVIANMFNRRDPASEGPQLVRITVYDIEPYREVYSIVREMNRTRQVERFPAFAVDAEGNVTEVFNHNRNIIPIRVSNY
jgi:hypothetical protein